MAAVGLAAAHKDRYRVLVQLVEEGGAIQRYTENKPVEAYEMIAEAIVQDPLNPRLPLALCK